MNIIRRIQSKLFHSQSQPAPWRISYSQTGEDLLLSHLLRNVLELKNITYLDIGTNDPVRLNNTYLFYQTGFQGVCMEPDPELCRKLQKARPRDTCLNVGAGIGSQAVMPFYVFKENTMNTFSQAESEKCQKMDYKLIKVVDVPMLPVSEIIERYLPNGVNLISIDAEGLDLEILKTVDFKRHRPEAVCVETIIHDTWGKIQEISEFMAANNYMVFADTYINTIFVEKKAWATRVQLLGSQTGV